MKKKQRRLVRVIAIVLAVLLAGSALVSAVFSMAYGEEAMPERNRQTLTMEYLENEQALRISQRLVYTNTSNAHLDRVVFYAPANLLRRQAAMLYASDDLAAAYPRGYAPGGIDLGAVLVDSKQTDWGFQGDAEIYLRVACDLNPGDSCEFAFDYYLLLSENHAFAGVDGQQWRLSDFYFTPAGVDDSRGEFILNAPLSFTDYIDTPSADFAASITLPEDFILAATGIEQKSAAENKQVNWSVQASDVYDFALSFGKYREAERETGSGTRIRALTDGKSSANRLLDIAEEALNTCESWFGSLPFDQIDLVLTESGRSPAIHSSAIWISEELLERKNADALALAVRFAIAKQYFGMTARARVSSDAWLSDSLCEYIAYLLHEEKSGHDAYLKALNENLVPSLQLTVPGGLVVTSDAALFTDYEYKIVILDRGAAVFHELRTAMGRDELILGLRLFYEMGLEKDILTEMDLVAALDDSSGGSWEKFLTDWVFNIGDYVNQTIDWLD